MNIMSENKDVKTEADEIMKYKDHMIQELCVKYKGKARAVRTGGTKTCRK
jgi:hypothetical protein